MRRYHGPVKYMSNFKAVQIDYEYYLTLSDKPQSVCLTERQMYVLSVQNTYTSWFTRWYNTDDITEKTVQFIGAEIEDLLMCGCGIPEPTFTDRMNSQTYVTNTSSDYTTTYNTWNTAGQTVASIAPNLDYSTGVPADIDKLMCLAYQLILTTIIESVKTEKAQDLASQKDLTKGLTGVFGGLATAGGAGLAIGGVGAAIVGFFGGPWLVFGLALAAVGTAIATLVNGVDSSALDDEDALHDVYCTMVINSVGMTPTRDVFQNALTPNDFDPGSHQEAIASVVQPYLDDLDTYLQFLVAANGLYDVSDFGALPECEVCSEAIVLTEFGYGGQVFGVFPPEAQSGMAFTAYSTSVVGSYPTDRVMCAIFDQACTITINSVTAWTQCTVAPSDAVWGYCPVSQDPNNLANWVFGRLNMGVTSIPIPWDQPANGIWLEGCLAGQFSVNMTLTII